MQTKKFSEWCDKIKDNHKFCVDEEMTREQFVTQLAISHFLDLRGCSWLIAAGYAAGRLIIKEKEQTMKQTYFLSEAQRLPVKLTDNLKSCRSQIKLIAKEELRRARRRYGKAWLHRDSADCYLITLAPDRRSAMWTSLALVAE